MTSVDDIAFLFDVDNMLLDNDRVQCDFQVDLASELGRKSRDRYWDIVEALCVKLGYADYLCAPQLFCLSTNARFAPGAIECASSGLLNRQPAKSTRTRRTQTAQSL